MEYTIYQSKANNSSKGLWYARPKHKEIIDLDGLAEHMANHNTPFSKGQIKAILGDMTTCIHELTRLGKKVKLDNLAIFRLAFRAKACANVTEFKPQNHIIQYRFACTPTGESVSSEAMKRASFKAAQFKPITLAEVNKGTVTPVPKP